MAKDTQLLVTIPGIVNENLARYKFYLQDKGVYKSKAELIVRLATIGLRDALKEVDEDEDSDENEEEQRHANKG